MVLVIFGSRLRQELADISNAIRYKYRLIGKVAANVNIDSVLKQNEYQNRKTIDTSKKSARK